MVKLTTYESAVKGRRDFRLALRECRTENKVLKDSRNELLKAIYDRFGSVRLKDRFGENFSQAIQKAEALKAIG